MDRVNKITAEKLLKVKAVKLQPSIPFTWASGWKSPIYCDNRKLMSYPDIRNFIKTEFCRLIFEKFPQTEVIAGVATGAIAPAAVVADVIGLPFVYVRTSPKEHGLENIIEGDLKPKQKVLIIEDLISTGQSSLNAVDSVRRNGCDVVGMLAIFTYGFPISEKKMEEAKVDLVTLSNYDCILEEALRINYIAESDINTLQNWKKNPQNWNSKK